MHGQFTWYELTTPDPSGAINFYPRFTNWGTQSFDADYTMFTHAGAPVAGIFRLSEEMAGRGTPPNWMPYVEASDVDATASKAKSLGATILVEPADIPDTGRYAVVQDPQGAVFGIYKSSRQSNAWDGTNEVGRFSWHELMTHDHQQAARFYSALFGWQKISEMDMGDGLMYHMYGHNGVMYGGMFTTPKDMAGMHPFWLVYIHVKDVGKAVEISTKNGAQVHRPQMDIPGGSIAILGDPQGAGYAVHHASAAAAAAPPPAKAEAPKNKAAAPKKKATVPKKKAAAPKKKAAAPKKKAAAPKKKAAAPKKKAAPKAKTKAKAKTKSKPKSRSRSKAKAPALRKAKARKKPSARRGVRRKK